MLIILTGVTLDASIITTTLSSKMHLILRYRLGIECLVLIVLPQEVSESFILFTFEKYVVAGLACFPARALYWFHGYEMQVVCSGVGMPSVCLESA